MDDLTGIKILVIEDDPDLNELVREELQLWGGHVDSAYSLKEAREKFEATTPAVIVSDVRLGDGDSLNFLREILKDKSHRPITIVISGYADISEEEEAELGVDAVFPKPTNWDEVIVTIQEKLKEQKAS